MRLRVRFLAVVALSAWVVVPVATRGQTYRDLGVKLRQLHRDLTNLEIEAQYVPIAEQAPDLNVVKYFGDSVAAFHPAGHLLLMEFWFAGCGYCKEMSKDLTRLDSLYRRSGLSVLGVNPYDWDTVKVARYCAQCQPSYPNLMVMHDAELDYGVYAYPTVYLLDEHRHVLYRAAGYSAKRIAEIEALISKHLQE